MNLDHAAFESPHVADVFQIMREDHHAEGTSRLVFAKIEIPNSFDANLHPHHFTADTLRFPHMLAGFANWDAVGSADAGCNEQE